MINACGKVSSEFVLYSTDAYHTAVCARLVFSKKTSSKKGRLRFPAK